MRTKTTLAIAVGALLIGVLGGMALGRDGSDDGKQSGPGPSKTIDGVPTGFAHSQDGAIAAASAYAGIVADLATQSQQIWAASIRRLATPESADEITKVMIPGLQSLAASIATPGSLIHGAPLGYRVLSYGRSAAKV